MAAGQDMMSIQDHIAAARNATGGNHRLMVLHLATQIEGLLSAAQAGVSQGYIRAHPDAGIAPLDAPDTILAAWERIEGLDAGAD